MHIKSELERLNSNVEKLTESFHGAMLQVHVDIATLKVKAGIWGAVGGAILSAVTIKLMGAGRQ